MYRKRKKIDALGFFDLNRLVELLDGFVEPLLIKEQLTTVAKL